MPETIAETDEAEVEETASDTSEPETPEDGSDEAEALDQAAAAVLA
ncbi:hypothetical protein [Streptomyces sp. NPDC091278]